MFTTLTEQKLCDDQFALMHNPKAKTYKRLPKGFKVIPNLTAPEKVILIDLADEPK